MSQDRAENIVAITHATEPYGGKLSECCVCGCKEICTPSFDFYCEEDKGPLKCECCMTVNLSKLGLNLGGLYHKISPGMKVRVIEGMLKGEEVVVLEKGRFEDLTGGTTPHAIIIEATGKNGKKQKFGKLAGDLEIIKE